MKKLVPVILLMLILAVTLSACGEEKETTLTGMVVSVDGTVISLVEMDTNNRGNREFTEGERPEMPEGMKGFDPENFDPEAFAGTLPNGETMPQPGDGERPQGGRPQGERPQGERPEMPEGMTLPEGMTPPEGGQKPGNGNEGQFENFMADAETKDLDIKNAHISVEEDGVKASGSLDDIKPGTFVTVTINGKGEVTNVLVSSLSGFGGGRRPTN